MLLLCVVLYNWYCYSSRIVVGHMDACVRSLYKVLLNNCICGDLWRIVEIFFGLFKILKLNIRVANLNDRNRQ